MIRPPWLHRKFNRLGWYLLKRASRRTPVPMYAEWGQRLLWRYPVPVLKGRPHDRWPLRRRHPLLDRDPHDRPPDQSIAARTP